MTRLTAAILTSLGLAACTDGQPLPQYFDVPVSAQRAYANQFQDAPFDSGPITVLSGAGGNLQSYTLTPCRNGAAICGARTGQLQQTEDFYVVTGAYAGRTFYLSPGGDGFIRRGGVDTDIAWN